MKNATARELDLSVKQKTTREWVKLHDILSNTRYQRPLTDGRVQEIAANFDPDAIGLPFVAEVKRGGRTKYEAIDGQHRVAAARIALGETQMIECEIIRGVSVERAAQLFRLRNNARKPQLIHQFLAGVTAGDDECVTINKTVESCGLMIAITRGDNVVQAVRALQMIYRGDKQLGSGRNPLPLKRTLLVLKEAWGPTADAFQAELIAGVGMVMTRHGEVIDSNDLIRKLKASPGGPLKLIGDAAGSREFYGGSLSHSVAGVVINRYNRGLRKGLLPAWRRSGSE